MIHPITEQILSLAARTNGVSSAEVPGRTIKQACVLFANMCNRGELHRAKMGHKSLRYFSDKKRAEAYEKEHKKSDKPANSHNAPAGQRARWEADAEAAEAPGFKKTVAPTPPPRFQTVDLLTNKPPVIRSGAMDFKKYQQHGRY